MTAKEVPRKLGSKLKAIRLHLGYTLEQMAEAVGKKGRSRRTRVYEWEHGVRQPDFGCQQMLRFETGVDAPQRCETPDQQTGADQQDHRDCDLSHH